MSYIILFLAILSFFGVLNAILMFTKQRKEHKAAKRRLKEFEKESPPNKRA